MSRPWTSAYSDYLKYVNHFSDFNYDQGGFREKYPFSIQPSNFDMDSILLFSCYGKNCNSDNKSFDILIQGDSWAEGLDKNIVSFKKPDFFEFKHNFCWDKFLFSKQYGSTIRIFEGQRISIQNDVDGSRSDRHRRRIF